MKNIKVRELMVPLDKAASVSSEATLFEAVTALDLAGELWKGTGGGFDPLLVLDGAKEVVGVLTRWDVVRAIEPRYGAIGNLRETSRYGFSPDFLRSMLDHYGLWRKPLEDLCRKAAGLKVAEIMAELNDAEVVEADSSLDTAIHQLVMGHHQCLLVREGGGAVGLLRLADVFREICQRMKECAA